MHTGIKNESQQGAQLLTAHRSPPTYIELHARSAFSFLRGAATPEELIAVCSEYEMPAMALLDNDGLYGAARFHLAAKKLKIKAHIGAEITVSGFEPQVSGLKFQVSSRKSPESYPNLQSDESRSQIPNSKFQISNSKIKTQHSPFKTQHSKIKTQHSTFTLPVIVRNRAGYQNLCRLITLMKLRVPKHTKPGECAVTFDELAEYAQGLVCLTGDNDGPLTSALNHRGHREAEQIAERLIAIFRRENVYAELQRHFNRDEEARNHAVIEIARRLKLPLLATNGVDYATRAQRQRADVFT